jgi:hypothetical protein
MVAKQQLVFVAYWRQQWNDTNNFDIRDSCRLSDDEQGKLAAERAGII